MLSIFPKKKRPHKVFSDAELIARYQNSRDDAYFEELFTRYQDKVLPICFKLLRNKEECQDACMEIFEKARKGFRKENVDKFNSWLFILIKNHCYDVLRKRKRRLTTSSYAEEELEGILWKNGPDGRLNDGSDSQEKIRDVEAALSRLDEAQRVCVDGFYCQGKSYKEIAEETGYTSNQVKSYLQNGIRNLRIIFNQQND